MSPLFLGIDLGTTAVKALAVDHSGAAVAKAEAAVPAYEITGGGHEQDEGEVWKAMVAAVGRVLAGPGPDRVAALSFSSAMHGFMAVDDAGRPLMRMMTWADARSQVEADQLARDHDGPAIHHRTGCPPAPLYYPARLRWLQKNRPEIFNRARRFLSLKDCIVYRLTGRWTMDRSHASSNGLLDLRRREWDPAVLAAAGIGPERLPDLVDSDAVIGELAPQAAAELGLRPGIAVGAGAGDGGLANLGAGAVDPGSAALTIGTSGAIRKVLPEPWTGDDRLWCYYLAEGRWYAGGAINSGGIVLRWLRDGLLADVADKARARGIDPYQLIIDLALQTGPGAEGLIFLPYLRGERTPYWDPLARGVLFGLAPHHGPAHLARATLEGICLAMAHVHQLLEPSPGGIAEIRATGGFARSPAWVQLLADVLGRPLALPRTTEGSALGAAVLAMKAAGAITSIAEAKTFAPIERVFEPDRNNSDLYRTRLDFFKGLYPRLREDFGKWNEISKKT